MGSDKLYRVSVTGSWYNNVKHKTYYVVAESREAVEKRVESSLKEGYKIKSISYLGEDNSFGRTWFSK